MNGHSNQLRAGVILSYINLFISTVIPFFYTPIVLRLLGQAEYGLYSLAGSVVGYLTLLSLGFGNTITRYLSKYRAEGNLDAERKTFGFFLIVYAALSILVLAGGFFISQNTQLFFDQSLTPTEIKKLKALTMIMAASTAISFPHSTLYAVITAHERFQFRQTVEILFAIAVPMVNLVALSTGFASVGLAVISLAVQIITTVIHAIYCLNTLKIVPIFTKLPKQLVMEMCSFSAFVFIATIVDMLFWAPDKVILGMRASVAAVAVYNIGGTFNSITMSLSTSISGVLVPRITGMVVKETPKEEWTKLLIRVGRLQFVVIALVISGFALFGQQFLALWAGPEYADSYWVAILTLSPLCIPLIQNVALSIVTAQNKHQFRAIVYLIIAVANVIATYLIIPYWGVIGAALCTCVSYLLGQGLIMNIYYHKVTGLDIFLFWRNILKMAIVPACMVLVGFLCLKQLEINSWLLFFGLVILYSAIYLGLMYLFSFNDYEKDMLRKPLRKVIRVLRKQN